MNKLKTTLALIVLLFTCNAVMAQNLSKSEKKKLKKEIKEYKKDPASYQKMKTKQKEAVDTRDETIASLQQELNAAEKTIAMLRDSLEELQKRYNSLGGTEIPKGTVYAVQIGFFKELNTEEFNKRIRTIRAENQDGGKRYVIGFFANLNDARKFRAEITKIGIDDAFISQYIDGTREVGFDAEKVK
ncbi:MAG: SPOR domain-containing protein [Flavobacteriales bacterium]|nr:SPOR domain-containing protein [Flavobacteriales bacterium]